MWGTGAPRREFLYVDDFADACMFVLKNYSALQFINIGVGKDQTIAEFAQTVAEVVGFRGKIEYDTSKPDGMPLKTPRHFAALSHGLESRRLHCGTGLRKAYDDFLTNAVRER